MEKVPEYYVVIGDPFKSAEVAGAIFTKCASKDEAYAIPNVCCILEKTRLPGKEIRGFFYPFNYSYKLIDPKGNPYFITVGRVKSLEYYFEELLRSAYSNDDGQQQVLIEDKNGNRNRATVSRSFDHGVGFFENIFQFIYKLHTRYEGNWVKYFQQKEDINKKIYTAQSTESELTQKLQYLTETELKETARIKELRAEIDTLLPQKQEVETLLAESKRLLAVLKKELKEQF